jgi:hypothetical protein
MVCLRADDVDHRRAGQRAGRGAGGAGRTARVGRVRQSAILSASDAEFIQAGNQWEPGLTPAAFLRTHGSDTWVLEYRGQGCGQPARGFRHGSEPVHQTGTRSAMMAMRA